MHPLLKQYLSFSSYTYEELTSWSLKNLPPFKLKDLDKAAQRLVQAIKNKETIFLYGDYDVDGLCALSLLYHYLKQHTSNLFTYQPDRFEEGYGLHQKGLEEALMKGAHVVCTVDLGISSLELAKWSQDKLDLIITDHHEQIFDLPQAYAVVNPNRKDETCHPHFKHLCGAGVAFLLIVTLNQYLKSHSSCYHFLPFVAIATLCDQVPLNPTNLTLTRHGLKLLQEKTFPGLEVFERRHHEEDVQFYIGPILNAQGRLEHAKNALKLLLSEDQEEVKILFQELKKTNEERKFIQESVLQQALKQVEENLPMSFAVGDWHEGVLGIVASKIVEKTKKPTFILRPTEEGFKGSARSVGDLHLLEILKKIEHCFIKYGGHKAAAGFLVKKECLTEFKNLLSSELNNYPKELRTLQYQAHVHCELKDLNEEVYSLFEQLRPFGQKHPKPIFYLSHLEFSSLRYLKDKYPVLTLKNSSYRLFSFNDYLMNDIDLNQEADLLTYLVYNDYSKNLELRPLEILQTLK